MRDTSSDPFAEKALRATPEKTQRARELRRRMIPAEPALWEHLRDHRLNGLHFRRQQPKRGFIIDLYCHAARLIIEVDGPIHNQQIVYDTERGLILTGDDAYLLRVTNDDVRFRLAQTLNASVSPARRPLRRSRLTSARMEGGDGE